MRRIWLLNFVGNAVLLALIYLWLTIPDRQTWQLAVTALLGGLIVAAALWLHTTTFAEFALLGPTASYGRGSVSGTSDKTSVTEPRPQEAVAVPTSGHLLRLPFTLCVAAVIAVLLTLDWLAGYFPRWSAWLGSALTLRLHRPVTPESILSVLAAIKWLLAWIVVPVLALPFASAASVGHRAWHVRKRFWLEYLAIYLAAWYLPSKLIHWVPHIENLAGQFASFILRFGIAWCLVVSGWVALAWASSPRPAYRK